MVLGLASAWQFLLGLGLNRSASNRTRFLTGQTGNEPRLQLLLLGWLVPDG